MSRSRKKHPFYNPGAGGMKAWKKIVNKAQRRNNKVKLHKALCYEDFDGLMLFIKNEVGNIYDSPKDGNMSYQHKPHEEYCYDPRTETYSSRWTIEKWLKVFRK